MIDLPTGFRFADPIWLWLIPGAAALAIALMIEVLLRLRAVTRVFSLELRQALAANTSLWRRLLRANLVGIAIACIGIALARPQTEGEEIEVPAVGRDVAFVVDISRSMLAQDLNPSRLGQAKLWIDDVLRAARGDRVTIVAFAGEATVICPPTNDYSYARSVVDSLSPTDIGLGGTNIGDAIRLATATLAGNDNDDDVLTPRSRDLFLITDGEDLVGSYPLQAAEGAADRGIRIITIGIGDSSNGSTIPKVSQTGRTTPQRYQGDVIRSKLDADLLRQIAAITGGRYFDVKTGTIELDNVYQELVRSARQQQLSSERLVQPHEWFQPFLGLALALLSIYASMGERKRWRTA
ncbi:MAG: VWA domain-containing protein [Planctomycetota bacterium]